MSWKTHGASTMGVQPYGRVLPDWYHGTKYGEWHGVIGWYTVHEATTNAADRTSVQIRDLQLWYLDRKNVWHRLTGQSKPSWNGSYPEAAGGGAKGSRPIVPLTESVEVSPGGGLMVHGGTSHLPTPWVNGQADIKALYFCLDHRAVSTAGAADVARSRYLVDAGIDFVPFVGATDQDQGGSGYWPNAGLGQMRLARPNWRTSDVLVTDPSLTKADLARITPPTLG